MKHDNPPTHIGLSKEQIYVVVDTPEKCKEAYRILTEAGEKIHEGTESLLPIGNTNGRFNKLNFEIDVWRRDTGEYCNRRCKTEISLPELEQMLLGGKKDVEERLYTKDDVISACIESHLKHGAKGLFSNEEIKEWAINYLNK